ncbi:RNA polymerase sigma factor [Rhizorhabdus dicambivorans]|uniref:RNA polymerase sigma factor n=1 Tax=Rhizorhabdus dicambivorans TaxID=1850238 RepID=A0A2A4FSM8_9SPHN|nr:RNA polymerase sigma factor [Rhizorhabdus dicambivorans]ATE63522.1 RNA polymerase sigma factor [Rhizorhabdus dicambivorans]PCE41423.1 RNA polymerase sigma factor [Rhizorhabdus dicambivorans]
MRDALPMDGGAAAEPAANLLERAYRSYRAELCRYIERQFGPGPPEPEEVVQSAFARFAALEKPQEISNPRAFLYACSRNVVLDARRRDRVRDAALDDETIADPGDGPANMDIERVLLGREQLAIVEAVVRAMEAKRRKVFIMHVVHGLRYVEIAREMRLSEARIRQLMASALAECQHAIDRSAAIGDAGR